MGIERARDIARKWIGDAERDYGMTCTYAESPDGDTAQFKRPGVNGTVQVTASVFTMDIKLGFLLDAFSAQIEQKVTRNLDQMLASQAPGTAA